jgi:hypothetical protein
MVVLSPVRSTVTAESVEEAIALVGDAGVVGVLEAELATTTGRPRHLRIETLFVALVLLALSDRPLHLTAVTELLWRELPAQARARLGVVGSAESRRSFLARYRQVRYLFTRICWVLDPEGLVKNRCVEGTARKQRDLAAPESARRRETLDQVVSGLVTASVGLMSESERDAYDGSIGLDATCVPLYSRGPSRRTGRGAADPDGGWYVRQGDHRGEEDHRGRVLGKVAWALEATIAVMSTPPGRPAAHPSLVVGLTLGRPGIDPGGTGTKVVRSVAGAGHDPGFLGADRAYSSAKAEAFHLPVRALGYSPVFDYRSDELGVQTSSAGALLVEGTWCCPAMPPLLVSATQDLRAGRIDRSLYATRIAARAEWRMSVKAAPDADGYERFSCPASGPRPRLACPHRPASITRRDGRTKVFAPPELAPTCCSQTSITIAPDVGARHRQRLAFATDEWAARYATCRNTIEGLNGYLKDGAHEALADPSRRRVRGLVAQSIFCALLVIAGNIRKLRAFRDLQTNGEAESVTRRASRRRRTSLADF